jgi:hypothetical protein
MPIFKFFNIKPVQEKLSKAGKMPILKYSSNPKIYHLEIALKFSTISSKALYSSGHPNLQYTPIAHEDMRVKGSVF